MLFFKKILLGLIVLFAFIIPAIATDSIDINWYVDGETYSSSSCEYGDDVIIPSTNPTKYGYTFVGWEPAVKRIEYLDFTGTQYIDTGIIGNNNTRIIMDIQINSGAGLWIFGSRQSWDFNGFAVGNDNGYWYAQYGRSYTTTSTIVTEARHIVDMKKTHFYVDDVLLFSFGTGTFTTPGNIYLARCYGDGRVGVLMYVYGAKIYDDGILVRDMIPVLDENNVPCMYDYVSGQFFYNRGTGDFIAGPVISE